ncbi:MAG: histone H1 [Melioribacteraceae bacterium]|nr:histone H1 [Melioribacteraceae bacterium]
MSEKYNNMIEFLKSLETDVEKFYDKGQAAAGTRIRKAMSELKNMAQDVRNEVQTLKSDRKDSE